MYKFFNLVFLLLISVGSLCAQNDTINKAIEADVIIENYVCRYTFLQNNQFNRSLLLEATILNLKGEETLKYATYYEGKNKIKNIQIQLFNMKGDWIRTVERKDFTDVKSNSSSFIDDDRTIYAQVHHNKFPYKVKFSYEMEHIEPWLGETFYAQYDTECFVKKAQLIINSGTGRLRFKENVNPLHEKAVFEQSGNTAKWTFSNLKPAAYKEWKASSEQFFTHISIAPNKFYSALASYEISDWAGFGRFYALFNQNRQTLPLDAIAKTNEICAGLPKEEKIKRLYEFLQKNMRYVSIQLGVGGWQTFTAEDVWKNKYGDCKALTNMMQSMLKVQGIQSFPALVYAGETLPSLDKSFAMSRFNHVILCVPNEKDTTWLECTATTDPVNYLGTFTSNREVLICKDDGGHIARTNFYQYSQNNNIQNKKIVISPENKHLAEINALLSGAEIHELIYFKQEGSEKAKKDWLASKYAYPNAQINQFTIGELEEKNKVLQMKYETQMLIERAANVSGKRIFIELNYLRINPFTYIDTEKERKMDFELGFGATDIDTITYVLPEAYTIESKISDLTLNSKFGNYAISFALKDKTLHIFRKLVWFGGKFSKENNKELADFVNQILKFEKNKLVLRKIEN
jgi:hypothetical protein